MESLETTNAYSHDETGAQSENISRDQHQPVHPSQKHQTGQSLNLALVCSSALCPSDGVTRDQATSLAFSVDYQQRDHLLRGQ